MEIKSILNVRYNECDMYGHVNHAMYLGYLEYARIEFLKSLGISILELAKQGFRLIIVKITIDYLASTQFDDQLEIITSVSKLRNIGGTFAQKIMKKGKDVVKAEVKWACINNQDRPVRIPPFLSDKIDITS